MTAYRSHKSWEEREREKNKSHEVRPPLRERVKNAAKAAVTWPQRRFEAEEARRLEGKARRQQRREARLALADRWEKNIDDFVHRWTRKRQPQQQQQQQAQAAPPKPVKPDRTRTREREGGFEKAIDDMFGKKPQREPEREQKQEKKAKRRDYGLEL